MLPPMNYFIGFNLGNFVVRKKPPHHPIDFGLTKMLSSSMKQALAKSSRGYVSKENLQFNDFNKKFYYSPLSETLISMAQ